VIPAPVSKLPWDKIISRCENNELVGLEVMLKICIQMVFGLDQNWDWQ
jgi:hypothetical protein